MLLRYLINGTPYLEVVNRADYDKEKACAYFYAVDAVITVEPMTSSQWYVLVNDMFVDRKLSLSEFYTVKRNSITVV